MPITSASISSAASSSSRVVHLDQAVEVELVAPRRAGCSSSSGSSAATISSTASACAAAAS